MSIWIPVGITAALAAGWAWWAGRDSHAATIGDAIGGGLVLMFGTLGVVIVDLVVWLIWALVR